MPPSLLLCLAPWIQDLMVLLDTIVLEKTVDSPDEEPRLKIWKRSLQICCNFVSRHRKHMDKYLPAISSAALKIVIHSLNAKDHPMQERILSLSFDLVSNILETGPGWRLMAPHFSRLLECAIFPALKMKEKDIVLWEEDEEEYLRKNLPSDLVCNFWFLLGFSDSCKSCSVLNSLFLLSLELFFGPYSLSVQISR
jgi:hypothetical protein